jgi:hypothetical protein
MLLPGYIINLSFGNKFNQPLGNNRLSFLSYIKELDSIEFGQCFNQELGHLLESTILNILYLPDNLKSIKFGHDFNKPIQFLPQQLESIIFGHNFNQSINSGLPIPLKRIIFGHDFNQDLGSYGISYIPSTLEYIELGELFMGSTGFISLNRKKTSYFPSSIQQIILKSTPTQFYLLQTLKSKVSYPLLDTTSRSKYISEHIIDV